MISIRLRNSCLNLCTIFYNSRTDVLNVKIIDCDTFFSPAEQLFANSLSPLGRIRPTFSGRSLEVHVRASVAF